MRRAVMSLGFILAATLPTLAQDTTDDLFSFMPDGGRTILERLLETEPMLAQDLSEAVDAQAWETRLQDITLDDPSRRTLADYLAYAGSIPDPDTLPWDGRDMVLARCQSCHIVTVVVTQARTRDAWLGTMNKPSHVEVPLDTAERGQLADYLVENAGLPIDAIPPALRAGGASY